MKFNLNEAEVVTRDFGGTPGVIPDDTECDFILCVLPGDDEESDNVLKLSKNGDSASLAVYLAVDGGEYDKRRIYENWYLRGDSEKAVNISMTKIRAIVDASLGLDPADMSPATKKKREFESAADIDGFKFRGVVGVEIGKGEFKDRNVLKRVLNPHANGEAKAKPAATKAAASKAAPPKKTNGKVNWGGATA